MDAASRQLILTRAGERCEYCHLPQSGHDERFSIDHVIPRKHGGDDALANLALSCLRCNLHKGTNLTGIDPVSAAVVELFNPRRDAWNAHFAWDGPAIVGLSPVGRATMEVLRMNAAPRWHLRRALLAEGLLQTD
jgi:hypothetical protein